jgi:ABC-type dipeptide/oligopeptide/nickel transport system ATPase component
MIEVVDLVKHYHSSTGGIVKAVDGVSFAVSPGEMVGLLGANGAGKTTTLRMLATLLRPTSGTARVAGHDVSIDPVGARRSLGYVSATTGVPAIVRLAATTPPTAPDWSLCATHGERIVRHDAMPGILAAYPERVRVGVDGCGLGVCWFWLALFGGCQVARLAI